MKKLLLILIILFAAEAWASFAVRNSIRLSSDNQKISRSNAQTYDNLAGRFTLLSRIPSRLTIQISDKDRTEIDPSVWYSTQPKFFPTNAESGLVNFFFHSSNTSHPWAAYQGAQINGIALNERALGNYLSRAAARIFQAPQDADMIIEGGRATKFTPQVYGRTLDLASSKNLLASRLLSANDNRQTVELPIRKSEPAIKLADLNDLGIVELVSRGQSDFSGSSASRIQNIRVGAARYNGLIIPKNADFSFNEYLGPIDAEHGFLPELVIKSDGTKPEFGGGLCQVSSTAFRAAFFGGLPILERKNHSYAVKYYEWISDDVPRAVGLDATIYPGSVDLKFKNDTPGAILIQTQVVGNRLYFDFYGTPDGRQVAVDGPHPFDRKASGAVKSKVTRTVTQNSGKIEETFLSNYVSPLLFPKVYEYPKVQPSADFGAGPNPADANTQTPKAPPPSNTNQPPNQEPIINNYSL